MNGSNSRRVLFNLTLATFALQALGTWGFARYEGVSSSESSYRTLLILLTHFPHGNFESPASRQLIIFLIIASLFLVAYLLKWFAEYMIGLSDNVKRSRAKLRASRLRNHYIVCGLGRVGSQVALELKNEGVKFVALDRDKLRVDESLKLGYLVINADSSEESALKSAGIEHAAGLVAALGGDSDNLLVTLAARPLNEDLYIVARANRTENEARLKAAGANRVALPYQIGGYHMATMAIRPNVVDYLDIINGSKGKNGRDDLQVEEMLVSENSRLAGHRLGKALADEQVKGATVIAINGADGTSKVRPTGQEVVYPGDRLIILGAKQDLTQASSLISQ